MKKVGMVALVVLVLAFVGVLLLVDGGSHTPASARASDALKLTPTGGAPRIHRAPGLPSGPGTLIAGVLRRTKMYATPGGRILGSVGMRTQFGSPNVLSVVTVAPHWLGVRSELAGNGRLGWIARDDAVLTRDRWTVRISLSTKTLEVLNLGRRVQHYTVGIGAAASPTPTGHFAVTDRLLTGDSEGPYGCCIVALTALAPHAIPGWTGGDRIAVHATPATETIGQPDSHGCVHLTQVEARWLVYHIPNGTPVAISG